jgi:hypothetical protein
MNLTTAVVRAKIENDSILNPFQADRDRAGLNKVLNVLLGGSEKGNRAEFCDLRPWFR